MKKLILIALLAISIVACKKTSPAPAAPVQTTTPVVYKNMSIQYTITAIPTGTPSIGVIINGLAFPENPTQNQTYVVKAGDIIGVQLTDAFFKYDIYVNNILSFHYEGSASGTQLITDTIK